MKFQNSIVAILLLLLLVGCFGQRQKEIKSFETNLSEEQKPQNITTNTSNQKNETLPPVKVVSLSCFDSDGGIIEKNKGTVQIVYSNNSKISIFDSFVSNLVLNEQYCDGLNFFSKSILCSDGCKDAACVKAPPSSEGSSNQSVSLSEYPSVFQSDSEFKIVLGDTAPVQHVQAAVEVATSLTAAFNRLVESKLASEISDPFSQSLLVIGNACDNPTTAKLLGNPQPCGGDIVGEGKIQLAVINGKKYVFISGGNQTDVRKAARVLAKYNDYSLSGTTVRVGGTLNNPVII